MESSDSNESDRDEEQMSQNTNSNSALVIVAGPTGVTGPHVIKFGYKEFPVKVQRWRAGCRNCNKRWALPSHPGHQRMQFTPIIRTGVTLCSFCSYIHNPSPCILGGWSLCVEWASVVAKIAPQDSF